MSDIPAPRHRVAVAAWVDGPELVEALKSWMESAPIGEIREQLGEIVRLGHEAWDRVHEDSDQ